MLIVTELLFVLFLGVFIVIILSKIIAKCDTIWNIALFNSFGGFDLKEIPLRIFSPAIYIRTNYHYTTGFADPFLFVDGDWLYLFYEEEKLKAPARICGYRTNDLKKWHKLGAVLQEDFHLSFPFTFRANDSIYMLPETRAKDAVILYKSIDFPSTWKPIEIISGDKFTDSSMIFHDNVWYLFTTVWYGETNGLRIYYSDNVESGWQEHPLSPVNNDISNSRCGGAVFSYEGKVYRPAQDCSRYYGEDVVLYEIIELTTASYSEVKLKSLIDKNNKWSKYGGHHFSMAHFNGQNIVAMDGITDDNLINNHTRKFFNFYYHRFLK
ncbi:MAG: hypothetical protein EOM47_12505 [Bacteroidia bacterium]|nr:hypothetical protein [Bacteroidia bacterium]